MKVPPAFLTDTVTVEPYLGETGRGPSFGDPVQIRCAVKYRRRVLTDTNGRDVVSEASLVASPDAEETFVPESRVTLDGRKTRVVELRRHRAGLKGTTAIEVMVA